MVTHQRNDAQGMEYDNSSSVRTVHDSSSSHPAFAKILATQRAVLAAQGPYPYNPNFPNSDYISDVEDDNETDSESGDMELEIDTSK